VGGGRKKKTRKGKMSHFYAKRELDTMETSERKNEDTLLIFFVPSRGGGKKQKNREKFRKIETERRCDEKGWQRPKTT